MKWFEANPLRFELEKRLLGLHHPGCKLIKQKGQFSVQVQILTRKRCYEIKGIFPDRFPNEPMQVQIEKPEITDGPPHYFHYNGGLCIYGYGDYGPETTAKVYLDWAKQWIGCYENWQKTGSWPKTNRRKNQSGEIQ
jgi:hypothetical protein